MTLEENKAVVYRFNKEFLEQGNIDVLPEIVHEKFTNHTAAANYPQDVSGLIAFVKMLHDGFSDMHITIYEQTAENDLVASRKTISAKHTGEIMGRMPTSKEVVMNVIDMVPLKEGKYIDHWGRNDVMQVIQSL